MNNEKNKKVWLKKCEETLRMGGRSEVTIKNYRYAIIRVVRKLKMWYNLSARYERRKLESSLYGVTLIHI